MRQLSLPRLIVTSLALLGISASAASVAAHAAVQNRIAGAISGTARVTIPNSVHPKVALSTDLGPAAASTKMQDMTLRFSLTEAQKAALDQLLLNQQNPSSPQYHQWLTPTQYAAQFGLSSDDIAKVTTWLTSQGLTVTGVANSGTFVTFSGTVAQVDAAFATSIHSLSFRGAPRFANVTNPSVPSALAGVVLGFTGLDNFRLKARLHSKVVPGPGSPQWTSSVTGTHYMAPGDFYNIYDEVPVFNSSITGTGVGTGAKCASVGGATCGDVAIMGQVTAPLADVTAFRAAAGLAAAPLPVSVTAGTGPAALNNCSPETNANCGSPNLDDLGESDLDMEWAGSTAPGATVLFVTGADVFNNSMTLAVDYNMAPILSISYGECEAGWGSTEISILNQLFMQANAQGQTVVGPAGDEGATDCDAGAYAIEGLAVDFPGSSPHVTSMGGTMFNEGSSTYWSSTDNTLVAGTQIPGATYSASTYIPEQPWNDVTYGYLGGGGGGVSAFFSKPYWQVGTPADASRDVPDLSLNASDEHDGYLYCTDGSCVVGFRETTNGNLTVAGGTSFATPTFAGILALVEQKTGSRIGNANPTIYSLANNSKYYTAGATYANNSGLVFNDVTSGNNAILCSAGTTDCGDGPAYNNAFTEGYSAINGYDLASGWGSVNAANLVNDWGLVTPIAVSGPTGANTSVTNLVVASTSVAAGSSDNFTATVTGSAGATPTGAVQFLVNNIAVGLPVALVSGVATYAWPATCSNLGQQVISASYSGDPTYAGSKGPILTLNGANLTSNDSVITYALTVQVTTGTCPSFSLSAPTTSVSVAANGIPTATITATSANGFTGTVSFTASVSTDTTGLAPGFSFNPSSVTLAANGTATTTLTLSGITSQLRLPGFPGKFDSGAVLARQNQQPSPRTPSSPLSRTAAGSGVAIASLLLILLPRRRRLGGLLMVVLSAALVFGASGCGSGTSAVQVNNNSFAGTYLITVVGTSGTNTQTTAVAFTIQ